MVKATAQYTITAIYDGKDAEETQKSTIQIILTNEHYNLIVDSNNVPYTSSLNNAYTKVLVFEGAKDVTSDYIITKTDPTGIVTQVTNNIIQVEELTDIITGATIEITATNGEKVLNTEFEINIVTSSSELSAIDTYIIPEVEDISFRSQDGNIYNPESLLLSPYFKNCDYSKWQYSVDGVTWEDVTSSTPEITVGEITYYEVKVNNTYYESFSNILDNQYNLTVDNNSEITILKNIFTHFRVPNTKTVTLNLNGYTITNDATTSRTALIELYGTLTVKDGSLMQPADAGAININSTGTVNIENTTIISTGTRQCLYNSGTANIKAKSLLINKTDQRACVQNQSGGTVNITGGTIISELNSAVENNGAALSVSLLNAEDGEQINLIGYINGVKSAVNWTNSTKDSIIKGKTAAVSAISKMQLTYNYTTTTETLNGSTYNVVYNYDTNDGNILGYVKYDANGGNIYRSLKMLQGSQSAAFDNTFTVDKFKDLFDGWYDAATGGNKLDDTTLLSTSTTVYAQYTQSLSNLKVITYDTNEGELIQYYDYRIQNQTYGELPVPIKRGNEFDGWYSTPTFTQASKITSSSIVSGDITLYAKWIPNEYNLEINSICPLFSSNVTQIKFKIVTDENVVDIVTVSQLTNVIQIEYATQEDIYSNSNRTYIYKPQPPYRAGDIYLVTEEFELIDDPDHPGQQIQVKNENYGKLLTCGVTRNIGTFHIEDWIVPLTAYTTVSQMTNVIGTDPTQWSSESKSLTTLINENTNKIEGSYGEMSRLAVRASDIEMSFSKTGTMNFLKNSSGQNNLVGWTISNSDKPYINVVSGITALDVNQSLVSNYAFQFNLAGKENLSMISDLFTPPTSDVFTISAKMKITGLYTLVKLTLHVYSDNGTTEIYETGSNQPKSVTIPYAVNAGNIFNLFHFIVQKGNYSSIVQKARLEINVTQDTSNVLLQDPTNDLGKMQYAGRIFYYNNVYTYLRPIYKQLSIVEFNDYLKSTDVKGDEVYKCMQDLPAVTTEGETFNNHEYIRGMYYTIAQDSLNPYLRVITDSYEIMMLDSENLNSITMVGKIPEDPSNPQPSDNVITSSTQFSVNRSASFIGDIMINGGQNIQTWTPRQDENLWGDTIKFDSDGITIVNIPSGYKRVLDSSNDVAYKIDATGTPIECIWLLQEDGFLSNNIKCRGTFSMGYQSDVNDMHSFTPVLTMQRTNDNVGIDEFLYELSNQNI